jgi:hypothetical protein
MREASYKGPKLALDSSVHGFSPEQLDAHWKRARIVFSVDGDDHQARTMRRLFDHFRLDPNDPHHWRYLVWMFAYAETWKPLPKRRGRPPEWTEAKKADLAAVVATLPRQSKAKLARYLDGPRSPFKTKGKSGSALRRRIPKAGT